MKTQQSTNKASENNRHTVFFCACINMWWYQRFLLSVILSSFNSSQFAPTSIFDSASAYSRVLHLPQTVRAQERLIPRLPRPLIKPSLMLSLSVGNDQNGNILISPSTKVEYGGIRGVESYLLRIRNDANKIHHRPWISYCEAANWGLAKADIKM